MENSLFHKETPEERPKKVDPLDMIEKEIGHLKKGSSTRYGDKGRSRNPPWLIILGFCGLAWLYCMDPVYHAWYKGEAARAYLYLHQYGSGTEAADLATSGILNAEEVDTLNHRTGSFQDFYKSPDAAAQKADKIILYMNQVHLLHAGKYQTLDPLGRMRCLLFVRTGLILPTDWDFLDPAVN